MNKQTKKLIIVACIIGLMCIIVGVIGFLPNNYLNLNYNQFINSDLSDEEDIYNIEIPWKEENSKQPEDYTRDEYESLTPAQKEEFKNSFNNVEDLDNWQEREEIIIVKYPWETGGKKPTEYTLLEYEKLSDQFKIGFKRYFGTQKRFDEWFSQVSESPETFPWEHGGKKPNEYTLAEYQKLSVSQQVEFKKYFVNDEDFRIWFDRAINNSQPSHVYPWENGGKQPEEYTLNEYNSLTKDEKNAFQKAFGSEENFNAWYDKVNAIDQGNPWENGGKQPSEYTLAEFNSLTKTQQMAFQKSFKTEADFEAWLSKVSDNNSTNSSESSYPWEQGGKKPNEYTYSEFDSLTGEQQIAFQNWFENSSDFDAWLKKVQSSSTQEKLPWEKGGKQPSEYTLEEFNELTASQQMAFQNSFGSSEEFETWLNNVQANSTAKVMPWETGGKLPNEYTLEEFNSLSGAQQIAFQKWFNSSAEFEAWLSDAQNSSVENAELPWENGGKQPQEYTWAEFEALSGPQQIAFQNYFENFEDFENWMNSALSE